MTTGRTRIGQETEAALDEVLSHVRGEIDLMRQVVDDPSTDRILAPRKHPEPNRQKFPSRSGRAFR